jgi:hypothetical protein
MRLDTFGLTQEENDLVKDGIFVPPKFINSFTTTQHDFEEVTLRLASLDTYYLSVYIEDLSPIYAYEANRKGNVAFVMKADNSYVLDFIRMQTSAKKFIIVSDSFLHTMAVGTIPASNKGMTNFISPKEVMQTLYQEKEQNIAIFFESQMAAKYPFANKELLMPTYHCNFTEPNMVVLSSYLNIKDSYVSSPDGMRTDYTTLQTISKLSVDIMRKIYLGYQNVCPIPTQKMVENFNSNPQCFINIIGVEDLMSNLNLNNFASFDTLSKIVKVVQEQMWIENNKLGGRKPFSSFAQSRLKENKMLTSPVFSTLTSMVSVPYTENYLSVGDIPSAIAVQKDLQNIVDNAVYMKFDVSKISEQSFISLAKTLCERKVTSLVYRDIEVKSMPIQVHRPEIVLPENAQTKPIQEDQKASTKPIPNVDDLNGKSIFEVATEEGQMYVEPEILPEYTEDDFEEEPDLVPEEEFEESEPESERLISAPTPIVPSRPVRQNLNTIYVSKKIDGIWNLYVIEDGECIAVLSSEGEATPAQLIEQYKNLALP